MDYLKQYRKVAYTNLLTSGKLNAYLADIDKQAQERFERLIEGMAVTKLSTLTVFGAAIPFFIKSNVQYVISMLPSFWIGKVIFENMLLYLLPVFVLSAMWICFLLKRYLRKI